MRSYQTYALAHRLLLYIFLLITLITKILWTVINTTEFDLIDGGVTANDPTLVALTALNRKILEKHPDFLGFQALGYEKFLVISIGTGSQRKAEKYRAKQAEDWGVKGWTMQGKYNPIVEIITESGRDMVQYHTTVLFQSRGAIDNYLRVDACGTSLGGKET